MPFALCNRNDPVNSRHVEGLNTAVGPHDLELVDFRRRAQSKVQGHIVLRAVDCSTHNVLPLSQRTGREIRDAADCIAWTFLRNVPNQSRSEEHTSELQSP